MTTPISRRAFFKLNRPSKKSVETTIFNFKAPAPANVSGLAPYGGPWKTEQVAHLLRRTMFGAKNTDVQYFKNLSPSQAVDELLIDQPMPEPPVNDYSKTGNAPDPTAPPGFVWTAAPYVHAVEEWRNYSLKCWWLGNMLDQGRSLREKMVLFWHNHIPIEFWVVYNARYSYRYLATIYENAFGNFKTLVKALTIDPAMLFYLNGISNNAGNPDENYARELQELFCIGKGPGSNYTEEDVKAAARVLTGWKTNYGYPETFFQPVNHDTDDKQFSAFYNNTVITGKAGDDGAKELDEMLDMIFDNDETALFICRKLYTFFVYQDINEQVEDEIIAPLAQLLRDNNYEIKPVLEMLLKSEHFFDPYLRGSMLKSPLEQIAGMCREMHMQFPPATEYDDLFQLRLNLHDHLPNLLQTPGDPVDVAGWPAWYQAPIFYKYWITVSTLPRRAEHSDMLLFSGYSSDNYLTGIDVLAFTKTLDSPSDPVALTEEIIRLFYGIEVADEVKLQLKNILLTGQVNDSYWTDAWYTYLGDPGNPAALDVVESRLRAFYQAILQLEEYQLL